MATASIVQCILIQSAMYTIEFTPEAETDLRWFTRREQNIIFDGIKSNLRYEPTTITPNRHPCRDDNKIADWELRLGVYRIYYEVDDVIRIVSVARIGEKPNNQVFFRNKKRR